MQSKALIIGAGGLGSPAAVYLSLAGVGTIGLVDFDVVELSNLQRQILHHTPDIGRPKLESAKDNIHAYNPDVNVVLHEVRLESENAMDIISQYDLVVNGADNFATRYLVNDACYLLKKPLVDGSILIFDGQATVFLPGESALHLLEECQQATFSNYLIVIISDLFDRREKSFDRPVLSLPKWLRMSGNENPSRSW